MGFCKMSPLKALFNNLVFKTRLYQQIKNVDQNIAF